MVHHRVTLIQCTDSKRNGQHKARDLYDKSQYYCRMRDWALAKGQPWYILSAKHGLLHPDTEIKDYNQRGLSERQAREIASELHDMGVTRVDVTAGMEYTNHLVPELETRGIDVINHFAGQKIGERRQSLKRATHSLTHATL